MATDKRASARHRVHLSVRYATSREFVCEYAENLSHGGLFVTGEELEPLQRVAVEITLPGLGQFRVEAEVAHILGPEDAERFGHPAGAGLAIIESPPGFGDALSSFLHRLGHRADHLVLTSHEGISAVLKDAGYQVAQAPEPEDLVKVIVAATTPIVAVVVPSSQVEEYCNVATVSGAGDIVVAMDKYSELDAVLTKIDGML